MNRLDFSSVMAVIRYYISPDHSMNQGELLEELFYSLHAESKEPIIFDGASVNRWLKGTERVSPVISRYYLKKRNQEKLTNDIEQYILPLMYDSDMAVQELYRLTVQDVTISDRQKKKLLKSYPCDTEQDAAYLITTLLCFSMERTFVRRTPGSTALMVTGSLSPASADFILNNRVPAPCRHFCGREEELTTLHGLLNEHGKVFITGIPGIGKSELAKAYAKQHKADYTNIVHLYYTGSLHEDIVRMDFADDLPDDTADARYERHARFLRTLKEDTLLIVDNFNVTAAEDDLLAEVMAYRCKVLFTTRCRFDEYPMLELREINDKQTLLHFMSNFYSEATQHQGIIGRNGSGKTVLMKCVCGFLKPTMGAVRVFDKVISHESDFAPDTGMLIETPGFLPHETGVNNLLWLARLGKGTSKERVKSLIEMVGLDPALWKPVSQYSLGMRQRLGIAQALLDEPALLILDEPMNGLDKNGVRSIRDLLLSLKAQGKTIILASHFAQDIDELCDTVCEMDQGVLTIHK